MGGCMSGEDLVLKASFGIGKLNMEATNRNTFNQGWFELAVDHDDNIDVFQMQRLLALKTFYETNKARKREKEQENQSTTSGLSRRTRSRRSRSQLRTPGKNRGRSKFKKNQSAISKSRMSFKKFEKSEQLEFDFNKFGYLVKGFNSEWLKHISLCKKVKVEIDDGILTRFIQKFSSDKKGKGIIYAEEKGFDLPLSKSVKFSFYFFDLKKFIQEERKFVLIVKEIQLLNLISCVVNGLAVCRAIRLPHGNLSSSTIFKKDKFEWEISPPLYSRVNLELRMMTRKEVIKMVSDPDYAIDYLVAPEVYQGFTDKTKCKYFY